jgi:CheY-like chemotaxis protein
LSAQEEKLRQNNQELASQQQALERVSHYKSQFLANMSHELRTPLNSMLVLSHLLAENSAGNLVDKQVEYASTIHAAGEDLLTLINQVLDLSKIEAGKEQVKVGPVPLADLAQGLGRIFRPLAEEKGLVFIVEVGSDVPATIESDRTRIERILMNLLGNAIKFTERGTINFTIDLFRPHPGSLRPAHRRGEAIAFSVSDTGIGIAESEQERIFAPFEQIEASSARRYQGTGLGLTIARESALLLGGELTLDSTPGEGSTFTFTLRPKPSRASKPSDAPAARGSSDLPPGSESHLQGQRVLVVEDDMRTAYSLLALLESKGCRVRVAENGHDALGELDQDPSVDCIVMDITMPDLNGYETMRQLRSRPGLGAVPIIALTANAAQEERERWLAAGASDHLAKPVDPASLLSVLQACAARQVRA